MTFSHAHREPAGRAGGTPPEGGRLPLSQPHDSAERDARHSARAALRGAGRPAVQRLYALQSDPEWLTTSAPVGQRVSGTAAHTVIEADFSAQHPAPDGYTELVLPGAQSGPSRSGGDSTVIPSQTGADRDPLVGETRSPLFGQGQIDIVRRNPSNGFKIADIKPAGLFGEGIDQVAGYLSQMTQDDPEMVAWRRGYGIIASRCGEMTDRMYTPPEYVRVEGRPVRVRLAVPGVVAYKEVGGEEEIFLCGVDDQGYADRLIDDVLVRARTWGVEQLDPVQQRVLREIAGLTLETLEQLLAPQVDPETLVLLRQLVVAGLAAAAVILAVVAVIVVVVLAYLAAEIAAAVAAALAAMEVGTVVAGLLETAWAYALRYGWTLLPAAQAATQSGAPAVAGQ